MIEMDKKYKTRSGLSVRILCTDFNNDKYTVIAAVPAQASGYDYIISVSSTGTYIEDEENPLDLIEVTPYDDFKEDDLCVVWNGEDKKVFRYFHKVNSRGKAVCFYFGQTSFCTSEVTPWEFCRKPTDEEIKTKTIKD